MKKRGLVLITCVILLLAGVPPAFAAAKAPTVILDGRTLSFDVPPQMSGNTFLVPFRAVFTAMGGTVNWDNSTKTATATRDGTRVVFRLNSLYPTVNDVPYVLATGAKLVNGRILAPLNFVVDAFGAQVVWDEASRTARIADGPNSRLLVKAGHAGGFDLLQHKVFKDNTDLLYPTVADMKDTVAQNRINATIERQVYSYRQLDWTGQGLSTAYTVRYKVGLNQDNLCSLVLMESAYPYLAANPRNAWLSITFDRAGRVYRLADLFSSNSDYVGRISAIVRQQFQARGYMLLTPFERIEPDQDFYLVPDGIVIYFQEDEYTPHSDGFPEFLIPFSAVRNLLAPQSPAIPLMRRR